MAKEQVGHHVPFALDGDLTSTLQEVTFVYQHVIHLLSNLEKKYMQFFFQKCNEKRIHYWQCGKITKQIHKSGKLHNVG